MPRIFDNIEKPLLPALQETLKVAERADFCVGYFNLRGWHHLTGHVDRWTGGAGQCCRLLVGMDADTLTHFDGVGNTELIDLPLLALIASRECPGDVFLETLERVPQWVQAGRVIVSGFHSPLEQQVLRSVLRRKGQVVKVLARGMLDYQPEPEEAESMAAGRMLVITACPPTVTRISRATALVRNRLVLAVATDYVVPHMADGSPLASLVAERMQYDRVQK